MTYHILRMLSVKMLYRALLIDCRYLSFPARVSVTSQEIWDGGGLRNCPRHFMCITCSSRSKVSFRLHEFCDSGKLVHEKKQSIVHVRISHWSTSLVLCLFLQMFTKVCQPSPNLPVWEAWGHPDEGPRRAHGNIHPQLAPKISQEALCP